MISRRSEYAVPNAETRHGSIGGNCQALPEECSEAENRKLLAQTIEEYEHNVSSEKKCASSNWKSDGEGNATMDNCGIDSWPSRCVQQRSTLHDVTVKARETPKGTGNLHEQEAAASSPCRVVGSGPASSAGEWDRPGPATAAVPTGIRVSTPHLPVWGRLTAGVTATTVAGAGRGPPASRCGVRPEPGLARPQARAQWRRGGAAAWADFGPAAGPGTVEARRGSRRAKFGPAAGRGTVEARRSSRRAKFGPAAGQGTIEARRSSRRASVRQ